MGVHYFVGIVVALVVVSVIVFDPGFYLCLSLRLFVSVFVCVCLACLSMWFVRLSFFLSGRSGMYVSSAWPVWFVRMYGCMSVLVVCLSALSVCIVCLYVLLGYFLFIMYVCVSVCSVCMFVLLYACLSVRLSVCLYVCSACHVFLCVCQSCLYVCISVCLSVCMYIGMLAQSQGMCAFFRLYQERSLPR